MKRTLAIGNHNFLELRVDNCFYVDKTKFIKDWWDNRDVVTLITRPRRFGKTLMLDTIKTFFSPEFAGQEVLFDGLDIYNDEKLMSLQGKIPVIFLSFANFKGGNYDEMKDRIKGMISSIYGDFSKIIDINLIPNSEKENFTSVTRSMSDGVAKDGILYLSKFLVSQNYGKPIILIDEYDAPLHEAWVNDYWDKLVGFMRGFLGSTFKDNPYLGRGLITGITRITKESIFSGMNNIEVISTTSNLYADSFGFTEKEVFLAMDEYGIKGKKKVKEWYDGFIFGNRKGIYNPWSIICFLKHKKLNLYWADTSSNELVGKLIAKSPAKMKIDIEKLLNNKIITVNLDELIDFSQLYSTKGAIWALLMATGYVKPHTYNYPANEYKISLTNYEVHLIVERLISSWFNNIDVDICEFRDALLKNDLLVMNRVLRIIAKNKFSYFDTGGDEPERFYHGFILGLIVDLKNRYEITSNQESGDGRYDVMLIPKEFNDHAIIIEFRTLDKKNEKKLEAACNNALKQIFNKSHVSKLLDRGLNLDNIFIYGFAFAGKNVLISGGAYNTVDWKGIFKKS